MAKYLMWDEDKAVQEQHWKRMDGKLNVIWKWILFQKQKPHKTMFDRFIMNTLKMHVKKAHKFTAKS